MIRDVQSASGGTSFLTVVVQSAARRVWSVIDDGESARDEEKSVIYGTWSGIDATSTAIEPSQSDINATWTGIDHGRIANDVTRSAIGAVWTPSNDASTLIDRAPRITTLARNAAPP